jgi:agmatinase
VVGIDIVEVSPPYDHAEITAFLANRVALEALSGMAARRHGLKHDPAGPLLEGR